MDGDETEGLNVEGNEGGENGDQVPETEQQEPGATAEPEEDEDIEVGEGDNIQRSRAALEHDGDEDGGEEEDGGGEEDGEGEEGVEEVALDQEDAGLSNVEEAGEGYLEEEEEGIDYSLGVKPFGDYQESYRLFEMEGEGRGDLMEYVAEDEEFAGEGDSSGVQFTASFSELDALIKALEGEKCDEGGVAIDSNQATMGSTMKETSDGQGTSMANAEEEKKKQDEDNVIVLGPDHPKMQRFQRALREHLNRQIYTMDCEIRDMDNEVKMRKKEREDLGNQLYNLQYELQRQTDMLDKCDKELENLIQKRTVTEELTDAVHQEYLVAKKQLGDEIENEKVVMKSIKEIDMMEWCVRQAAEEFDGELKIRQLVDEKFEKLRHKTELEKRDQDFYLDKILTHIQRLEQANEGIQRQIQAHNEEQKELTNFITEAETEIEALHIEKVHLQRAWNETVAVVRSRDEALNAARETLRKTKEMLRNREAEMRSLQRAISKEQESHERATVLLKRRKVEERYLENQVVAIQKKNEELRNQLTLLYSVRKQVEDELRQCNRILVHKEKELSGPRRRLEALHNEKSRLEDAIMETLQEQASLGKIAQHISNKVEAARDKARKLEAEAAKVENEMTKVTVQVERLRGDLLNKEMLLSELERKLADQEKVLSDQALEVKEAERLIQRKTGEVVRLNKKLQKLIDQQGGREASPLEREIEDLERKIAEEKEHCADLQNKWLKQQDDLVSLTVKRDEVLRQNDLIRKEAFIMERKKQRLTNELEQKKTEIKKVEKEIGSIRHQISAANARLHDERVQHNQMDRDNILLQNEFVNLLKDAEMEALQLQEEITALENEKERLADQLTEAHEQALNWDKKIKYARELKESIKKEQEQAGSTLKLAIHHMKVRYQELCRAQEKLMIDLERSIERRDRIIQEADFNLKRAHIHPKKTKLNIQRNYNKLKERNRILTREAVDAEKQVQEMELKVKNLEKQFECESQALQKIKEMVKASDDRISEAAIQKHKNLIEIILRQQKYKVLESIKQDRYKPLAKSKEHLEEEMKKIEGKCLKLVELSDNLIHEFPELELHIKLIKASILPSVK